MGTRSGVRIGTSASDLRSVYPDNIQRANDAVAGGEALAFVPNDEFDANYRIYFEIVDGAVARYRLGIKPAVDFLNGCASGVRSVYPDNIQRANDAVAGGEALGGGGA